VHGLDGEQERAVVRTLDERLGTDAPGLGHVRRPVGPIALAHRDPRDPRGHDRERGHTGDEDAQAPDGPAVRADLGSGGAEVVLFPPAHEHADRRDLQ